MKNNGISTHSEHSRTVNWDVHDDLVHKLTSSKQEEGGGKEKDNYGKTTFASSFVVFFWSSHRRCYRELVPCVILTGETRNDYYSTYIRADLSVSISDRLLWLSVAIKWFGLCCVFSKFKTAVGVVSLWYARRGPINPDEVDKVKGSYVERPKPQRTFCDTTLGIYAIVLLYISHL